MFWTIFIFFAVFLLIMLGLNYYFFRGTFEIFGIKKSVKQKYLYSVYIVMGIFVLMLLDRVVYGFFFFYLAQLVNYYIGILGLSLFFFLVYDIIKLVSGKEFKKYVHHVKKGVVVLFVATFLFSIYMFEKPIVVKQFEIESDKISKEYVVLQITDPQYGSVGKKHLREIERISKEVISEKGVDFIVFTGDFVDSANFKKTDLDPLLNFGVPVYFVFGNHEFYHNVGLISDIVEQEYVVLRNESVQFDEINLIGFDDANDPKQVEYTLSIYSELIDKSMFNLLLYHRPTGVLDAKDLGVDFMVTGHTHGGQFFPYTLTLKWFFEFPQGLVQIDDFYLYTSDGAGLWGPKMRIGTENEIAVFTIKPEGTNG